ncbi:hypothetical protein [Pseudomonas asiatica]|uniref:Y-family DNA polymerase n=1 Tax=Pseudomonas asiatica TaxID=2219225 RepID=UPI0039B4B9D5
MDEAWLDLKGIPDRDLDALGRHIQHAVYREVGIPVGAGISITKSLAKLANWASKKWTAKTGAVVDLRCPMKQAAPLRRRWRGLGHWKTAHNATPRCGYQQGLGSCNV